MEIIINALIENLVQIAAAFLVAVIGVAGTWLTTKIGKIKELQTIQLAIGEAKDAARTTVLELQQTIVDGLKNAAEDGKLTEDEILSLNNLLITMTKEKMSASTINILTAAGADLSAIITGAGEAMIAQLSREATLALPVIESGDETKM